jgi:hypothetical protein
MIRNRAKGSKVQDASIKNVVNPYPTGTFAANGKDYALNAVYMKTVWNLLWKAIVSST